MIIIVFARVIGKWLVFLLSLLMVMEMTWRWRFMISSDDTCVCTNGYPFSKQLIKYPSKNPSVKEPTSWVYHLEYLKEMWLV